MKAVFLCNYSGFSNRSYSTLEQDAVSLNKDDKKHWDNSGTAVIEIQKEK